MEEEVKLRGCIVCNNNNSCLQPIFTNYLYKVLQCYGLYFISLLPIRPTLFYKTSRVSHFSMSLSNISPFASRSRLRFVLTLNHTSLDALLKCIQLMHDSMLSLRSRSPCMFRHAWKFSRDFSRYSTRTTHRTRAFGTGEKP